MLFVDHVFDGHADVVGGGDVGEAELVVLGNVDVVGVVDGLVDVEVAVEQDRGHSEEILSRGKGTFLRQVMPAS